jgi:hypothetical protein
MKGLLISFSVTRLFEKGFLYIFTTESFIVDIISLKYKGVLFTNRYRFLKEENNRTFLKKLAKRIKTVLLFVKDLPFNKNLDRRPNDKKKYVSPSIVLKVGKKRLLVKLSARVLVGLWNFLRCAL